MPRGVEWIQDKVVSFDPKGNSVLTAGGEKVEYDYLVVAAGFQLNWSKIKGRWVGRWIVRFSSFRMRYCGLLGGGWIEIEENQYAAQLERGTLPPPPPTHPPTHPKTQASPKPSARTAWSQVKPHPPTHPPIPRAQHLIRSPLPFQHIEEERE